MSLREVKDTVYSRLKQKQNEIYSLSAMVRVAVLSVFSDNCKFPSSPDEAFGRETEGNWKNSLTYMKALAEKRRCKK